MKVVFLSGVLSISLPHVSDNDDIGKSAGLLIHNGGNGLLDSNEIFKNALTGILLYSITIIQSE